MAAAHYINALNNLFLPLLLFILPAWTLCVLVLRYGGFSKILGQGPFLLSFATLGGVSGLIAGASQTSIVEALLTGLLGLVSALLSYLFGKESLAIWRPAIPFALILLVSCTLGGLVVGGAYKTDRIEAEKIYARRWLLYEKVDLEICKQKRLLLLQGKSLPQDYVDDSCSP
jgi:hypothetical protein